MLTKLTIKNYALIDDLQVSFEDGFTTITGETGAGKSILLGALSLVLGKRADLSSLKNQERKCIIEAEFAIGAYQLQPFFAENDLDFEFTSVFRREILPSGKSRAFINDTPVNLNVMNQLGEQLVDVHSQHQTLQLGEQDFQLKVIDALADNSQLLEQYRKALAEYKTTQKKLAELESFQTTANKEFEYNSHLLQELQDAKLVNGLETSLTTEYEQLSNVETILETLAEANQLFSEENMGVLVQLQHLKLAMTRLTKFGDSYKTILERLESVLIESQDLATEVEALHEQVEANPERFEQVSQQLTLVNNLLNKHKVSTAEELITYTRRVNRKGG